MNIRGKASTAAAAWAFITMTNLMAGGLSTAAHAGTATDGPITHEQNPRVPQGAAWTEAYFPSSDGSGVELHADVLRPAHLPADAKTPVIVSVGPYFSHVGQSEPEGWDQSGPSTRFQDFVDGAKLMARGYTYVMVDLRGFGGSTGCLDWAGPGEQADVRAAVEWAASRPWSNGKVGMYGKSYDAITGLVGNNLKLRGLKAVVAQEPVWDMYNYLFSNKVPRPNVTATPEAFNAIVTMPAMADDSDRYKANAEYEKTHPQCLSDNLSNNNDPDPNSAYWRARNLPAQAAGSTTPLFVTQGFIEPNTKPEDMDEYLAAHSGRERGWLGQWPHVRGNDTDADDRLMMGRAGWFDEVMRFYDQYLLGINPPVSDPAYAIEDSLGRWRAQNTWPVATSSYPVPLSSGQYVDDGGGVSAKAVPEGRWDMEHAPPATPLSASEKGAPTQGGTAANTFWTWSTPATKALRLTATPTITLNASTSGNVMVRLWDVAPDGTATMFDENVALLEKSGSISFDLKSTDWTFQQGHRMGVQIGTIIETDDWGWLDVPSGHTIKVSDAWLSLSMQNPRFDVPTQGDRSPYLDEYIAANTTTLTNVGPGTFPLNAS
ncbi:CocE/NonD family hydrolase [Nonomuraea aurantiaca]|uniref:CocE/NonD family hydrolase n=1 Tax=Nonomuraea aurantiaca TaxID=2878562 RepID=UPI001CD9F464|nr:CocE/NonD family hydrolase [Nonomuraea aurantiaca]MCA2228727.1 CocE/NonD family hydrolase [Nonomuraea aurantiaca]